jgi:hypothetical protein
VFQVFLWRAARGGRREQIDGALLCTLHFLGRSFQFVLLVLHGSETGAGGRPKISRDRPSANSTSAQTLVRPSGSRNPALSIMNNGWACGPLSKRCFPLFVTVIEQKLFVMFLEHRMRAFQGTFHANPDYALWYGWSEMQRDLTEIKTLAGELREKRLSKK